MEENVNNGDSTGAATPNAGKTFSQAELDAIITDRLNRQKAALEAKQAKAQQDAEQRTLAEQQQYKELAEQHARRVQELEPVSERAERYATVLNQYVEAERKGLPKPILALLDKMDVADQLEWIVQNKGELTKPKAPDLNASAQGSSTPNKEDRVRAARDALLNSGGYSGF